MWRPFEISAVGWLALIGGTVHLQTAAEGIQDKTRERIIESMSVIFQYLAFAIYCVNYVSIYLCSLHLKYYD